MRDPYVVLGVTRTATGNEIKSAYRRLARKYHPDVNTHPAAARKFALVNESYHLLIDPERRKHFDRTGMAGAATTSQRRGTPAETAARRAYYQARADRIVNEWLQKEREESRARGKAVYTTVTLFISTFIVAVMKPSFFESATPLLRTALVVVFGVSVWHLYRSLKEHFEHYTYRQERLSVTRSAPSTKPFRRSIAWLFVIGGYLFSLTIGMLLRVLTDDLSKQLFGPTSSAEAMLGVLFYPPIVVLIVDVMYRINLHLEDL